MSRLQPEIWAIRIAKAKRRELDDIARELVTSRKPGETDSQLRKRLAEAASRARLVFCAGETLEETHMFWRRVPVAGEACGMTTNWSTGAKCPRPVRVVENRLAVWAFQGNDMFLARALAEAHEVLPDHLEAICLLDGPGAVLALPQEEFPLSLDLLRALVRSKLPWVPAELGARLEFMEKVLAVTPEEVRAALSPPSDAEISVRAAKAAQPWGRR